MKGILMKPDLIRQVIAGNKTRTRRIIRTPKNYEYFNVCFHEDGKFKTVLAFRSSNRGTGHTVVEPKFRPGEVVYIKETYCIDQQGTIHYKMDDATYMPENKWISAMFMPLSVARHFIIITGVNAEKVQEITDDEAIAEGIKARHDNPNLNQFLYYGSGQPRWYASCSIPTYGVQTMDGRWWIEAKQSFASLWNMINTEDGDTWEDNPWVFVYEFELVKGGEQ